jgi:hypothetical protein
MELAGKNGRCSVVNSDRHASARGSLRSARRPRRHVRPRACAFAPTPGLRFIRPPTCPGVEGMG